MSDTTFYGTGRRKRSVARVYLSPGKGNIKVNGESFRDYLCRDSLATIVMQPLVAVEGEKAYDIEINAMAVVSLGKQVQFVTEYPNVWLTSSQKSKKLLSLAVS